MARTLTCLFGKTGFPDVRTVFQVLKNVVVRARVSSTSGNAQIEPVSTIIVESFPGVP